MANLPGVTSGDLAVGMYEGGPVIQGYQPGAGAFEPDHPGIDIGLGAGAPVKLLQTGNYQEDISSPYKSVFLTPQGTYEDYLHLDAIKYTNGATIQQGTVIGTIAPGTASNYYVPEYGGAIGGPYTSTGPHLHIADYFDYNAAQYDLNTSSFNPSALLTNAGATTNTNTNPIQQAANALGQTLSGIQKGTGDAIKSATDPGTIVQNYLNTLIPKNFGIRTTYIVVGFVLLVAGLLIITKTNPVNVVKTAAIA